MTNIDIREYAVSIHAGSHVNSSTIHQYANTVNIFVSGVTVSVSMVSRVMRRHRSVRNSGGRMPVTEGGSVPNGVAWL